MDSAGENRARGMPWGKIPTILLTRAFISGHNCLQQCQNRRSGKLLYFPAKTKIILMPLCFSEIFDHLLSHFKSMAHAVSYRWHFKNRSIEFSGLWPSDFMCDPGWCGTQGLVGAGSVIEITLFPMASLTKACSPTLVAFCMKASPKPMEEKYSSF